MEKNFPNILKLIWEPSESLRKILFFLLCVCNAFYCLVLNPDFDFLLDVTIYSYLTQKSEFLLLEITIPLI
jgi:hypothetical protein